jgi:hypothetical protein
MTNPANGIILALSKIMIMAGLCKHDIMLA